MLYSSGKLVLRFCLYTQFLLQFVFLMLLLENKFCYSSWKCGAMYDILKRSHTCVIRWERTGGDQTMVC